MTLIIRKAQMDALAQDREQQFERRMMDHLRRRWEPLSAEQTEAELLSSIREAMKRAGAHGLARTRDVALYIELRYLVGPAFESDPPWVGEILRSERHPTRKMDEIRRRLSLASPPRPAGSAERD